MPLSNVQNERGQHSPKFEPIPTHLVPWITKTLFGTAAARQLGNAGTVPRASIFVSTVSWSVFHNTHYTRESFPDICLYGGNYHFIADLRNVAVSLSPSFSRRRTLNFCVLIAAAYAFSGQSVTSSTALFSIRLPHTLVH